MSLILNESLVLAKTRSQDLKSVLKLNCWGSGIKDVSLVRQLVNVEVIGLSCNEITTLEDFAYCKKLKELTLRGNKIKNISEIAHLQKLPALTSLWLQDNPCVESTYNYRKVVLRALPQLKTLDNKPVTREELQEIEELGDEIYEEVQYESSSSHSSGPQSHNNNNSNQRQQSQTGTEDSGQQLQQQFSEQHIHEAQQTQLGTNQCDQSFNETNLYQPTQEPINESLVNQSYASSIQNSMINDATPMANRSSRVIQSRLSSQGSMNALNGNQYQQTQFAGGGSIGNNNNNMNILPKGGKSRSANILSAVLCLVKELDYVGCEVVQTALNCRMEETQ